ncbi:MAG TPA: zinc ribbon domain-containing protein [Puia sp.]|nr:zinc ribbon domain-containing protein [Puia sp.]
MEPKLICQSCTMPIDNVQDQGTEKDGTKSKEYCKYCYQNGSFVNPDMSFQEMKSFMEKMTQEMKLPQSVVQQSLAMLPNLKRWKSIESRIY